MWIGPVDKRRSSFDTREKIEKSEQSDKLMEEIAISPAAGEHGTLDSLFHYFRSVTDGYELPCHR
jgi:hypothetical protein